MKTGKTALTEKVHTVFSASRPEISVVGVTAQPGRTQLVLSSVSKRRKSLEIDHLLRHVRFTLYFCSNDWLSVCCFGLTGDKVLLYKILCMYNNYPM